MAQCHAAKVDHAGQQRRPCVAAEPRFQQQRSPGVAAPATAQGRRCCRSRRLTSSTGTTLLLPAAPGPLRRARGCCQDRASAGLRRGRRRAFGREHERAGHDPDPQKLSDIALWRQRGRVAVVGRGERTTAWERCCYFASCACPDGFAWQARRQKRLGCPLREYGYIISTLLFSRTTRLAGWCTTYFSCKRAIPVQGGKWPVFHRRRNF